MLVVLDEHTRECHRIRVGHQLDSGAVIASLPEVFELNRAPKYLRSDTGGEFITDMAMTSVKKGRSISSGCAESCRLTFWAPCSAALT